jgi:hypothetical protein
MGSGFDEQGHTSLKEKGMAVGDAVGWVGVAAFGQGSRSDGLSRGRKETTL